MPWPISIKNNDLIILPKQLWYKQRKKPIKLIDIWSNLQTFDKLTLIVIQNEVT